MADFAKKLAAGMISVPQVISWWPRHSRMMLRYLIEDRTLQSIEAAKQSIVASCMEWESAIPAAARKGLMGHHAALEVKLADLSRAPNAAKIDKIGALLIENAGEMAASFGRSIVEFPEEAFHKLFIEHVASFVEIVRLHMEGCDKKMGPRMERSTLCLAAFTGEWF
jgi:hypothetical protein